MLKLCCHTHAPLHLTSHLVKHSLPNIPYISDDSNISKAGDGAGLQGAPTPKVTNSQDFD